jgi:hypothetical protein
MLCRQSGAGWLFDESDSQQSLSVDAPAPRGLEALESHLLDGEDAAFEGSL